jgi:hypothetical protein
MNYPPDGVEEVGPHGRGVGWQGHMAEVDRRGPLGKGAGGGGDRQGWP